MLLPICIRFTKLRNVLANPMTFEDFRSVKAAGKLVHNHPDFKALDGTLAVWVDDKTMLPEDIKAGLAALPADMPIGSPEARYKRKWEALLANPSAYEDLRPYKSAVPARNTLPDFRVIGSGARDHALWLDPANEETALYLERLDNSNVQPSVVQPDA